MGVNPSAITTSSFVQVGAELDNVSTFLDACVGRCVKPTGLRSISAVRSRVAVLQQYLGDLALSALEPPGEINPFKTESDYAEDVEIATMHRALETLRAAMNPGMAQTPPLFNRTPLQRFGVRLTKKAETTRDRRLSRDEERRLLDTALQKMNAPEHPADATSPERDRRRTQEGTGSQLEQQRRPLRLAAGS